MLMEEMDRRMVHGGKDFVKDMAKTYNITEKIKQMGRQRGWQKLKRTVPFRLVPFRWVDLIQYLSQGFMWPSTWLPLASFAGIQKMILLEEDPPYCSTRCDSYFSHSLDMQSTASRACGVAATGGAPRLMRKPLGQPKMRKGGAT
ncbi:MAG: hypothetical protein HZA13_05100 [Nitrospirae bacterium]|nr:hypothetical protein [Nitrospirota bacterium]